VSMMMIGELPALSGLRTMTSIVSSGHMLFKSDFLKINFICVNMFTAATACGDNKSF